MKSQHPLDVHVHLVPSTRQGVFGNPDGYYHVRTWFYPKTDGWLSYQKNDIFWKDLCLNSQGNRGSKTLYGIELEYREPFSVNLREAEHMLKTLKHFDKKLEKAANENGYPLDVEGDGGYIDIMQRILAGIEINEFRITIQDSVGSATFTDRKTGYSIILEALGKLIKNEGVIHSGDIPSWKYSNAG